MEFSDMKKIWDTQNEAAAFGYSEEALHRRIVAKMKQGRRITHISELLGIIVNTGAGCFIFAINFFGGKQDGFMYALSGWMLLTGLYLLLGRVRRIKGSRQFDRSMQGSLDHAISVAAYQVNFSRLMRWNILPIGVFILLGFWKEGKPLWLAGSVLVFFVLTGYASGWEHTIYKSRKRELEELREKLAL